MGLTRHRAVVAGISLLAALGLTAVVAPSASAGPGCAVGRTCVWDGDDYSGASASILNNNVTWTWAMTDGKAANNRVQSVSTGDLTSCRVFFYDDEGFGLDHNYIYFFDRSDGRVNADPYLANGGGAGNHAGQNWANRFSSNQYTAGCTA